MLLEFRCGGSKERPLLEEFGRLLLKFGAEVREGALVLPRGPPLPAHGGRSLITRAEFWDGAFVDRLEPKPCGRSFIVRGEFCAGAFAGRFELPNPCGARPRSVALPCASQLRELLPGRSTELPRVGLFMERPEFCIADGGRSCASSRCRAVMLELPGVLELRGVLAKRSFELVARPEFAIADGGRFCESSRCRAVIPELAVALPGRLSTPPFARAEPLTGELPTRAVALALPFTCEFPNRPALVAPLFIVRTGE